MTDESEQHDDLSDADIETGVVLEEPPIEDEQDDQPGEDDEPENN